MGGIYATWARQQKAVNAKELLEHVAEEEAAERAGTTAAKPDAAE